MSTDLVKAIELKFVKFQDVDLLAVKGSDGKIYTSVKKVCEDLGIDNDGQIQRIKRDETLNEGACIMPIQSNGGIQATYCIEVECLPLWLAGIKINKCKEEIRPYLKEFKKKVKDVLANAFITGPTQKPAPVFQIPQTLSEALLLAGKLAKDNEEKDQRLQIAEPKALLLDAFTDTTELKTVRQLGYKLKAFGLGPNKIFEFLREEKIITKVNGENYPTDKYTDYFVTTFVTKAWVDSKTGATKNKTFDILKVKQNFYGLLAGLLVKKGILTLKDFSQIDFNSVPVDSSIDNQLFY